MSKDITLGCSICSGIENDIYIESVRPNSLSAELGLERGDQIIKVNDIEFNNITLKQASYVLKREGVLKIHIKKQGGRELFLMHYDKILEEKLKKLRLMISGETLNESDDVSLSSGIRAESEINVNSALPAQYVTPAVPKLEREENLSLPSSTCSTPYIAPETRRKNPEPACSKSSSPLYSNTPHPNTLRTNTSRHNTSRHNTPHPNTPCTNMPRPTMQHSTTKHYKAPLPNTPRHNTPCPNTSQHNTLRPNTSQHNTPCPSTPHHDTPSSLVKKRPSPLQRTPSYLGQKPVLLAHIRETPFKSGTSSSTAQVSAGVGGIGNAIGEKKLSTKDRRSTLSGTALSLVCIPKSSDFNLKVTGSGRSPHGKIIVSRVETQNRTLKSKIKAGDQLFMVDGCSLVDISCEEARNLIGKAFNEPHKEVVELVVGVDLRSDSTEDLTYF